MNRYPQWMNEGFGPYAHDHGANPLEWAIFALLLVLALIVAAYLVRTLRGDRLGQRRVSAVPGGVGTLEDPLQVLRMRYARGEVSRDDFLQGTSDLTSVSPAEEAPPQGPDEAPTQT